MPNQYMHDEATLECMSDGTTWEYPYPMAYFQLANAHGGGCASGAATPGQNLGNPICADVCVDGDGYDLHGYGCWRWPTPGGNCIPGIAADYTAQGRGRTLPPS